MPDSWIYRYGGVLLVGAGLAPAIAGAPLSLSLPYYARTLAGPPHEILCLNVRNNKNPLIFGHSSLTSFSLENGKLGKSLRARSVGLWPFKKPDPGVKSSMPVHMRFDDPADHFATFAKGGANLRAARYCVPITLDEAVTLDDFLMNRKSIGWSLAYNCNDLSTDAFAAVTGIEFRSRSALKAFCSTPQTLYQSLEKFRTGREPAGRFVYRPKAAAEADRLAEAIRVHGVAEDLVEETPAGHGRGL